MPSLSAFHGLVISMPANDHDPPHFHVWYAGVRGRIVVETGEVLPGSRLPRGPVRLAEQWRQLHVEDLLRAWAAVRDGRHPGTIDRLP